MAALLCARDTDSVIDDDTRHATGLSDGQVVGLMRHGPSVEAAMAALATDAPPLLDQKRITHAGIAVGHTPTGQSCAAVVGSRRLVENVGPRLWASVRKGVSLPVTLHLPADKSAALFVLGPDGFVTRSLLEGNRVTLALSPRAGEGRYVAEVVVDALHGPSDPEVAFVWPWTVGAPREAPFPEVLFPDDGHDETALSHRAETLLQRLRNEQLLDTYKLSPALTDVARERASAIAARGALGHRIEGPAGVTNALEHVKEHVKEHLQDSPRAQFVRLAEVQAQASTLADAWRALLDSPAHRHVLVDPAFTHAGTAVVRGRDAAGRPTITMLALVARRPPERDVDAVRAQFFERTNAVRTGQGFDALEESAHLHRVALRLARAMADVRRTDETLLGGPVSEVALESDASFTRITPLVARTDDPMLLLDQGPPALLLDIDATHAGVGIALEPDEGVFFVTILVGQ